MGTLMLLVLCAAPADHTLTADAELSARTTIAMMPLSTLGSTKKVVQTIERVLVDEFRAIVGDRLVPPKKLFRTSSSAKKALIGCEGVATCITEVIGGMGFGAFVVGNIAGLGERRVIHLKLYDVHSGKEIRRASEPASGNADELIGLMRKAAVQLVAPDRYTGTLTLVADQPNLQLSLDGNLLATTPLTESNFDVPAGRHAFEARGDGLVPFSAMVDISYREVKELTIHLPPNDLFIGGDTPYRKQWWTWAAGGAGVMSVGLGSFFNVQQAQNAKRIKRLARQDQLTVNNSSLYAEERANWNRAVAFYSLGAAVLVGVGTLWLLDVL